MAGIIQGFRENARILLDRYAQKSYGQEGEDLVLARYFANNFDGFYVDVGAHHPLRFSNTYLFYRKGWRGINIDPRPGSMKQFEKWRPRDTNLEIAIGRTEKVLPYYMFDEPALNGFSKDLSLYRETLNYKIIGEISVPTQPLSKVLARYLPSERQIDFLTVDVEGLDLEVLESNDWNRYRPKIVVAEILDSNLKNLSLDPIDQFLEGCGYQATSKTTNTVLYMDKHNPFFAPSKGPAVSP